MEHSSDSSLFGMNVDQNGKAHLAEAARWAKFLAIIGFIICGLIVLAGLFVGSFMSVFSSRYGANPYNDFPAGPGFTAAMTVYYIVIALIYFFPNLFLFRFATKMKTALASNNQEILNSSFQNLKATFRYLGIVTLIMVIFMGLGILVTILGVATAGSM